MTLKLYLNIFYNCTNIYVKIRDQKVKWSPPHNFIGNTRSKYNESYY